MYRYLVDDLGVNASDIAKKKILITGATGLIGKSLVESIAEMSCKHKLNIHLILLVRSKSRIDKTIYSYVDKKNITIIEGDINNEIIYEGDVDYVIHTASITDSRMMVEKPVEVISTSLNGTKNVLEFAKSHNTKSVVYLSTMEIYGFTTEEVVVTEEDMLYLNPLSVRNSYPESKRMAENMCVSYYSEYNVPVKIIRLAQTFGKGVLFDDRRVFAEFARKCVRKENIVLLTSGLSKRMYLDIRDAVTAILTVLFKGKNAQAYNAANKNTYCSIVDMANMVANFFGNGNVQVYVDEKSGDSSHFSPPHKLNLDVTKLEELGWTPKYGLYDMYSSMIEYWNS